MPSYISLHTEAICVRMDVIYHISELKAMFHQAGHGSLKRDEMQPKESNPTSAPEAEGKNIRQSHFQ